MISIRLHRAHWLALTFAWVFASALISGCSGCGKDSAENATPPADTTPSTHVDNAPGDHLGSQRTLPPYARPGMRVGITLDAGAN